MYAVMLLLGTIAACVTLSPGLQDVLRKVSYVNKCISALPVEVGTFSSLKH